MFRLIRNHWLLRKRGRTHVSGWFTAYVRHESPKISTLQLLVIVAPWLRWAMAEVPPQPETIAPICWHTVATLTWSDATWISGLYLLVYLPYPDIVWRNLNQWPQFIDALTLSCHSRMRPESVGFNLLAYRRTSNYWIALDEKTSVYRGTQGSGRSVWGPDENLKEFLSSCRSHLVSLAIFNLMLSTNCEIKTQILVIKY